MTFDETQIRECYRFLGHEKETEIRVIIPGTSWVKSLFVHSEDEFVETCKKFNGKYNIYAGINERTAGGTEGKDVISVKTLVIDLDAIREKGEEKNAATDDELKKAELDCDKIISRFESNNQPRPVKVYTGNGYQLWIAIPKIEIFDNNRALIEDKLQQFQDSCKIEEENSNIDKIGDLPRIIKVWGTLNIKGEPKLNRPHRVCKVIGNATRIENEILKNNIIQFTDTESIKELDKIKKDYPLIEIQEIDESSIPGHIKYLLYEYVHKGPDNWMRIIQVLASFFRGIGANKDYTTNRVLAWNAKQPYHEEGEESDIKHIVDRIYRKNMMCPNFDKLLNKDNGYPYFGLKSVFEGVKLYDDWITYKNPVVFYLAKSTKCEKDVQKLIFEGQSKSSVFTNMNSNTDWLTTSDFYKELTYQKALNYVVKKRAEIEQGLAPAKKLEVVKDIDVENIKIEELQWLVQNLIPTKALTLVAGKSSSYKSTMMLHIAYCIANGTKVFGTLETKQGRVLYMNEENSWVLFKPLLAKIRNGVGKGYSKDLNFVTFQNVRLDTDEGVRLLAQVIEEHGIETVVMDSLKRFIGFEENSADNVNKFYVDKIKPLMVKYGIGVIMLHHAKKDSKDVEELDMLRGSSDFVNIADSILFTRRMAGKTWFTLKELKNRAKLESAARKIMITEDKERNAFEFSEISLAEKEDGEIESLDCAQMIINRIKKDSISDFKTKDANGWCGNYSRPKVTDALNELVTDRVIVKMGMGHYRVNKNHSVFNDEDTPSIEDDKPSESLGDFVD